MIPLNIIVAIDSQNGIGKEGNMPWELEGDIRHFREVTSNARSPKKKNVVVMGRKTWESIPPEYRPLPNRTNIVLTTNRRFSVPEGVMKADSFEQVLKMANDERLKDLIETIFIIGGQQVYEKAIEHPGCEKLYVTRIQNQFDCDVFFPQFEELFELTRTTEETREGPVTYHFEEYKRKDGTAA